MIPDDDKPVLSALRDEYDATDAERARVWAKLRAVALAAPAPVMSGARVSSGVARSLRVWKWASISLVAAVAGTGIWHATARNVEPVTGAVAVVEERDGVPGSAARSDGHAPVVRPDTGGGPVDSPPSAAASPLADAVVTAGESAPARAPSPVSSPPSSLASPAVGGRASVPRPAGTGHETAPSATAPRSRPTVVDSLEEETRLLSSAARAAKSGAFERAFAFVDEHEQRFPKGQLAAERDVQRISLLCSTGRDEEARRRAKAFLEGRESSALTRRVEQSCAAR